MAHATYTEFRQSLASFMDQVCDSRAPLTVTRQKGRSVVVLDESEYDSMVETIHLLRSPTNAHRLTAAMAQLDAGNSIERDIVE